MNEEFKLLESIGRGSYGHVFKAKQITTGNIIALKQMEIHVDNYKDVMNEVEIMKTLRSPFCVRYVGCYFNSDTKILSIAMEYAEYGSIANFVSPLFLFFFYRLHVLLFFH